MLHRPLPSFLTPVRDANKTLLVNNKGANLERSRSSVSSLLSPIFGGGGGQQQQQQQQQHQRTSSPSTLAQLQQFKSFLQQRLNISRGGGASKAEGEDEEVRTRGFCKYNIAKSVKNNFFLKDGLRRRRRSATQGGGGGGGGESTNASRPRRRLLKVSV